MAETLIVTGNQLRIGNTTYRCAIGKGGISKHKKEGDGITPAGIFPLRECWYRADRLEAPHTKLPLRIIHEDDGWCDDPRNMKYNRHFKIAPAHPLSQAREAHGFEHMWLDENIYDVIVPIGYNDAPVVPGKGSAIFMHVAKAGYMATEGCVALQRGDLMEVLAMCAFGTRIDIREA